MSKICPICKLNKNLSDFNSQNTYCKICHNEKNRLWRENNKDKYLEANVKHNSKRIDSLLAWKKTPKGKIANRNKSKRYRARLLGAINHHTNDEWLNLLEENNYSCVICNTKNNITKDHIVPLSKGGDDSIDNIQPMCMLCNSKKGAK